MIKLKNIKKSFPLKKNLSKNIIADISFEINENEFVTILGPNGCGKSTLLNIIAGLEEPSEGSIEINDSEKTAYIFQDYRTNLLPWNNVLKNIIQPLIWAGKDISEARIKALKLIETLNLSLPIDAYPYTLSGGQSQLISILRSIIIEPTILLADEPFSALDFTNRWKLSLFIRKIWIDYKFKCLFVSHDIDEAIFLGNKVIILSNAPTNILKIIEIPFPIERDKSILLSSEFSEIKRSILDLMNEDLIQ